MQNLNYFDYYLKSLFRSPVNFALFRSAKSIFAGSSIVSLLTVAAFVGVPRPAQAIGPAYTTTNPTGAYYDAATPASFGFWFDTVSDVKIDALGFSSQAGWPTGNSSYDVSLWSYTNGGNAPSDFTLIATRTFTPTVGLPSYWFQDNYFWQSIPIVTLPDSTTGDSAQQNGYVLGTTGDFSTKPGNVQYEGGNATFKPDFIGNYGVYNFASDPQNFYPIPVYLPNDPTLENNIYFNANLSIYPPVPGPLPLMGAASAFAWSRRLTSRIRRASK